MDISALGALKALGYRQVAAGGADAAINLPTIPSGASCAVIKPNTQGLRLRDDATDPTTAIGYPIATGTEYIYFSSSIGAVRIISSPAGAGVDILYYG